MFPHMTTTSECFLESYCRELRNGENLILITFYDLLSRVFNLSYITHIASAAWRVRAVEIKIPLDREDHLANVQCAFVLKQQLWSEWK